MNTVGIAKHEDNTQITIIILRARRHVQRYWTTRGLQIA